MKYARLAKREPEFRRQLPEASVFKSYDDGAHLNHCGDDPDGLYGILSGSARVTVPVDDGQEYEAHRAQAGFWVGDLALLSDTQSLIGLIALAQHGRRLCRPPGSQECALRWQHFNTGSVVG